MELNQNNFYTYYLKEYHRVRATYLKNYLDNIGDLNRLLKKEEHHNNLTENTKIILQADLRQNYFHSIETFFELLFAFLPTNDKIPDNRKILQALAKSKWRTNFKKIEHIAHRKLKLNFLDNQINFLGHEVSVGHYIFYPGTFSKNRFGEDFYCKVSESIQGIKDFILTIANDFMQREEYNSYKHAIRIYPSFKSIHVLDAQTLEEQISWDIGNSASYQTYDDRKKKTAIKTIVYDADRDFKMACLCSDLIYSMIMFRDIVFNKNEKKANERIAVKFFTKNFVTEISQHNVEIQDLVFSSEKVSSSKTNRPK